MNDANFAASAIEGWCVDYLTRKLRIPQAQIYPLRELDKLGLDSVASIMLIAELEQWLGVELSSGLLFDHRSIAGLARHLAAEQAIIATLKRRRAFQ